MALKGEKKVADMAAINNEVHAALHDVAQAEQAIHHLSQLLVRARTGDLPTGSVGIPAMTEYGRAVRVWSYVNVPVRQRDVIAAILHEGQKWAEIREAKLVAARKLLLEGITNGMTLA